MPFDYEMWKMANTPATDPTAVDDEPPRSGFDYEAWRATHTTARSGPLSGVIEQYPELFQPGKKQTAGQEVSELGGQAAGVAKSVYDAASGIAGDVLKWFRDIPKKIDEASDAAGSAVDKLLKGGLSQERAEGAVAGVAAGVGGAIQGTSEKAGTAIDEFLKRGLSPDWIADATEKLGEAGPKLMGKLGEVAQGGVLVFPDEILPFIDDYITRATVPIDRLADYGLDLTDTEKDLLKKNWPSGEVPVSRSEAKKAVNIGLSVRMFNDALLSLSDEQAEKIYASVENGGDFVEEVLLTKGAKGSDALFAIEDVMENGHPVLNTMLRRLGREREPLKGMATFAGDLSGVTGAAHFLGNPGEIINSPFEATMTGLQLIATFYGARMGVKAGAKGVGVVKAGAKAFGGAAEAGFEALSAREYGQAFRTAAERIRRRLGPEERFVTGPMRVKVDGEVIHAEEGATRTGKMKLRFDPDAKPGEEVGVSVDVPTEIEVGRSRRLKPGEISPKDQGIEAWPDRRAELADELAAAHLEAGRLQMVADRTAAPGAEGPSAKGISPEVTAARAEPIKRATELQQRLDAMIDEMVDWGAEGADTEALLASVKELRAQIYDANLTGEAGFGSRPAGAKSPAVQLVEAPARSADLKAEGAQAALEAEQAKIEGVVESGAQRSPEGVLTRPMPREEGAGVSTGANPVGVMEIGLDGEVTGGRFHPITGKAIGPYMSKGGGSGVVAVKAGKSGPDPVTIEINSRTGKFKITAGKGVEVHPNDMHLVNDAVVEMQRMMNAKRSEALSRSHLEEMMGATAQGVSDHIGAVDRMKASIGKGVDATNEWVRRFNEELEARKWEEAAQSIVPDGDPLMRADVTPEVIESFVRERHKEFAKFFVPFVKRVKTAEGKSVLDLLARVAPRHAELAGSWIDDIMPALERHKDVNGLVKDPQYRAVIDDMFDKLENVKTPTGETGIQVLMPNGKTRLIQKAELYFPRTLKGSVLKHISKDADLMMESVEQWLRQHRGEKTIEDFEGAGPVRASALKALAKNYIDHGSVYGKGGKKFSKTLERWLANERALIGNDDAFLEAMPDMLAGTLDNGATQRLRMFGHVERPRLLKDHPFPEDWYEADPRKAVLPYIDGAARRIAEYEIVGRDAEMVHEGISKIGPAEEANLVALAAKRFFNIDKDAALNPRLRRVQAKFITGVYNTKVGMGYSFVPQVFQPLISFIPKYGGGRAIKGAWEAISDPNFRELMRKATASSELGIKRIAGLHSGWDVGGRGAFFEWLWDALPAKRAFEFENKLLDYWAAGTYDVALRDLIKIADEGGSKSKWARRSLQEDFKIADVDDLIKMSKSESRAAEFTQVRKHSMFRGAKESQLHTDVLNEPEIFSDKRFSSLLVLKRFQYKQMIYAYDTIMKEWMRGNKAPMLRMLSYGVAGGWAQEWARTHIRELVSGAPVHTTSYSDIQKPAHFLSAASSFGAASEYMDVDFTTVDHTDLYGPIAYTVVPVGQSVLESLGSIVGDSFDMFVVGKKKKDVPGGARGWGGLLGSIVKDLSVRFQSPEQRKEYLKGLRKMYLDDASEKRVRGFEWREPMEKWNEALRRTDNYSIDLRIQSTDVRSRSKEKKKDRR